MSDELRARLFAVSAERESFRRVVELSRMSGPGSVLEAARETVVGIGLARVSPRGLLLKTVEYDLRLLGVRLGGLGEIKGVEAAERFGVIFLNAIFNFFKLCLTLLALFFIASSFSWALGGGECSNVLVGC